jgi:hypothetical protein
VINGERISCRTTWGETSEDESVDGTAGVEVYSLGPNRRRDESDDATSDDIAARRSIDPYAPEPMPTP